MRIFAHNSRALIVESIVLVEKKMTGDNLTTAEQDVLDKIEAEGVDFLRLQFTDILGTVKNVAVPARQAEKAFTEASTSTAPRLKDSSAFRNRTCVSFLTRTPLQSCHGATTKTALLHG